MLILLVLAVLLRILATEEPHGGAAQPPAGMQAEHASAEGALVGVRHPGGAEMQAVVSPLGAVQEALLYGPTGLVAERRYEWRPDGLLKSVEDSTGLELFQYDSRGQLIRASGVWSEAYQYDARGAPTRQTEPSGKVWTTALGSGGRIVARSDGAVIERQHYDGAGQLTERHDGLGGVVKLRYDGAGRVRAVEEGGVLVLAIELNAEARRALGADLPAAHLRLRPLGADPSAAHLRLRPLGAEPFAAHLRLRPLGADPSAAYLRLRPLGAEPFAASLHPRPLGVAPPCRESSPSPPRGGPPCRESRPPPALG